MEYIAIYTRNSKDYYRTMRDSSYSSKRAFAEDLRRNGYRVAAVFTQEQIEEIKGYETTYVAHSHNLKYSLRLISYIRECMK